MGSLHLDVHTCILHALMMKGCLRIIVLGNDDFVDLELSYGNHTKGEFILNPSMDRSPDEYLEG